MRKKALVAILDAIGGIGIVAAAALSQGIKRAIAEQAVEVLRPVGSMARKILAFCVAKEPGFFWCLIHKSFSLSGLVPSHHGCCYEAVPMKQLQG